MAETLSSTAAVASEAQEEKLQAQSRRSRTFCLGRLRDALPRLHSCAVRLAVFLLPMWALLGVGVIASPAYGGDSSDARYRIFAPNSFWYTPIPADAPLHPNSLAFVRDLARQIRTYYNNVEINTVRYSSPVYFVGNDVALVRVAYWDCQNQGDKSRLLDEQWSSVPVPRNAQPADGTDSEMTIYRSATDTLWEFWRAEREGGRWEACWGGRMLDTSQGDGIWAHPFGATATGLPFIGGQIAAEELSRGAINHAMGIALVETDSANIFSWPANRSDGYNPSNVPNRIPEGLRFRLDPTVDVEALRMHPAGRIIAKAAQTYGFVVWDKAGSVSLRAENPKSFTTKGLPDPYPAIWNGTPSYDILRGFPWGKLQFLPMNYGRP
jgi:hypothetical protein